MPSLPPIEGGFLPPGDDHSAENALPVVHACPQDTDVMACCGRTPFEVPVTDRMTLMEEVTCRG